MSSTAESFRSLWRGAAAILVDCHLTVAALSGPAEALFPAIRPGDNLARQAFLGSEPGRERQCALDASAQIVAVLHGSIGKNDDDLRRIVGELSALSRSFSRAWARDAEPLRPSGVVRWSHPAAGAMSLRYELLTLADSDDMVIVWEGGDPASVGALDGLLIER